MISSIKSFDCNSNDENTLFHASLLSKFAFMVQKASDVIRDCFESRRRPAVSTPLSEKIVNCLAVPSDYSYGIYAFLNSVEVYQCTLLNREISRGFKKNQTNKNMRDTLLFQNVVCESYTFDPRKNLLNPQRIDDNFGYFDRSGVYEALTHFPNSCFEYTVGHHHPLYESKYRNTLICNKANKLGNKLTVSSSTDGIYIRFLTQRAIKSGLQQIHPIEMYRVDASPSTWAKDKFIAIAESFGNICGDYMIRNPVKVAVAYFMGVGIAILVYKIREFVESVNVVRYM